MIRRRTPPTRIELGHVPALHVRQARSPKNACRTTPSPAICCRSDHCTLEFLGLTEEHSERELRKAVLANLRDFFLEFGRDLTFVGDEYRTSACQGTPCDAGSARSMGPRLIRRGKFPVFVMGERQYCWGICQSDGYRTAAAQGWRPPQANDHQTVPASHDEDERHSGLLTMVQEQVAFPFRTKFWARNSTWSIWSGRTTNSDWIWCASGAGNAMGGSRNVELIPPLPEGYLYLAAYLAWKRML